jgi:ABC-type polysaccharide/polyol phosphate export permease
MSPPIVEIQNAKRLFLDLTEAWRYRRRAIAVARRKVPTRYTQTASGLAWHVIQPIMSMGALSASFGKFLHVPSYEVWVLVFVGTA